MIASLARARRRPLLDPRGLGAAVCLALVAGAAVAPAAAVPTTPESPRVQAMVARALKFLADRSDAGNRSGARALVGLAFLKAGEDRDHPRIREAIAASKEMLDEGPSGPLVYSLGLGIIFLANLDPQEHGETIRALIERYLTMQKPEGGWGYPNLSTGDTSMTQYGVLSMWEAHQAGFSLPAHHWERVCNWLIRTQDPSGGFGYQGYDPGSYQRARQNQVSNCLTAAGTGSLLICNDLLLGPRGGAGGDALDEILKPVESNAGQPARRPAARVDRQLLARAIADGTGWLEQNYNIAPGGYQYYYLYALERMETFRLGRGERPGMLLKWYEDGVELLEKKQLPNGSWVSGEISGPACDTAFGVLFLVRSTRKSLERALALGAGTLVGGRGIPAGAGELEMRGGRITAKPLAGPAAALLAIINDPAHPEYLRAVAGLERLATENPAEELGPFEARLRELAGGTDPEARLAAVRALGRNRKLDNVPILIYALTDPDPEVVIAARGGLEFISRKFQSLGPADYADDVERQAAVARWKDWYRGLRPEAKFHDEAP